MKEIIKKGIQLNNKSLEFVKESKDAVSSLNYCLIKTHYNREKKHPSDKPVHFLKLLSH